MFASVHASHTLLPQFLMLSQAPGNSSPMLLIVSYPKYGETIIGLYLPKFPVCCSFAKESPKFEYISGSLPIKPSVSILSSIFAAALLNSALSDKS